MEPKGRRKRSANQLQGPAVQDQAVRPQSEVGVDSGDKSNTSDLDMLVIQFGDLPVSAYSERCQWPPAEDLDLHGSPPLFRPLGSDAIDRKRLEGVKGISAD